MHLERNGRKLRKVKTFFDFQISGFSYIILITTILSAGLTITSPYTISYDGFYYIRSAEVLFTPDFGVEYQWVREPGYPLFIFLLSSFGGLLAVIVAQSVLISFGILATIYSTYRVLKIKEASWKTVAASTLALFLIKGYAVSILQQAAFIAFFGALLIILARIAEKRKIDRATGFSILTLVSISTLTAVHIGLSIALAIFITVILSRAVSIRAIATSTLLSLIAVTLVLLSWSQVRENYAPPASQNATQIGSDLAGSLFQNFNLTNDLDRLLIVQLAVLNLTKEEQSGYDLGIAFENRLYGSPIYSPEEICGRIIPVPVAISEIRTSFADRCVPQTLLSAHTLIGKVSHPFYPVTGLILIFALMLSIRHNPALRYLVLPAFLITLPYFLSFGAISRYGVMAIPLACILLFELFSRRTFVQTSGVR
jgi:hypothetical protein